jgi:hypothetical protein
MKTLISATAAGLLLLCATVRAEIAIIVNPTVELDSITVEQVERLYLNRADRYPQGVKLTPIDQPTGSELRKRFVQKALWKTEIEVAEYWSRRMFSGKGRPPRQYEDDAAVIEEIIDRPGTLGYIDGDSIDERVKVLLRLP